jgi:hypothetical protein
LKKITGCVVITALVTACVLVPATASNARERGGWSERSDTTVTTTEGPARFDETTRATVSHRGAAETKVINGTSNKRAHGWTTWAGVNHYTTAQLERGNGAVITSSGRKWGVSGTEAISAYRPFSPNAADSGWGHAKTYYGR